LCRRRVGKRLVAGVQHDRVGDRDEEEVGAAERPGEVRKRTGGDGDDERAGRDPSDRRSPIATGRV